ncbi:MAG: hypothetical protein K0Q63_1430 [Paenibacillus sp.]|nr:hypothetical protein [Paenibacillus sp.]
MIMAYDCIFCKDSGSFGGREGREFRCYCVTEKESGCKPNGMADNKATLSKAKSP